MLHVQTRKADGQESHTALVGQAAGAVGDAELEAQRAGDGSWTQVHSTFCWKQKGDVSSGC